MTTAELLTELRRKGVTIAVAGSRLHVKAPRGVLTPDLLAELRARKVEVLATLEASRERAADPLKGRRNGAWAHDHDPLGERVGETFASIASWWIVGAILPENVLEAEIERAWTNADIVALQTALDTYSGACLRACRAVAEPWKPA